MRYAESQDAEMELAFTAGRQPRCIYCEKPLDEVRQLQDETIVWNWDPILKKYKKSEDGSSEKPYHPECGNSDWGYVDEQLVSY